MNRLYAVEDEVLKEIDTWRLRQDGDPEEGVDYAHYVAWRQDAATIGDLSYERLVVGFDSELVSIAGALLSDPAALPLGGVVLKRLVLGLESPGNDLGALLRILVDGLCSQRPHVLEDKAGAILQALCLIYLRWTNMERPDIAWAMKRLLATFPNLVDSDRW